MKMRENPGNVYCISYHSTSIIASDFNMFPFQAGPNTRVLIEEFILGKIGAIGSNFGLHVARDSTTPITTSYLTPIPMGGWSGHSTATSLVNAPTTTITSTANSKLVYTDVAMDALRLHCRWADMELAPNQRLDFLVNDLSPTASEAHIHASLVFREIGKNPRS